ncbi:MAG: hypothetical protein R6X08_12850 [Desulfosalsimonadaceae bacterium]
MSASCGLRDLPRSHLQKIQSVLARYPQVEAAVLEHIHRLGKVLYSGEGNVDLEC